MPARHIAVLYWGRRGPFSKLLLELWRVAASRNDLRLSIVAARDNEMIDALSVVGDSLEVVKTFESASGAVLNLPNVVALRRRLRARLAGVDAAVWLIPHVWTPFVSGAIREVVPLQAAIVHDARPHAGDITGHATPWINASAFKMDRVLTLSNAVADALIEADRVQPAQVRRLFHPVFALGAGAPRSPTVRGPGAPMRVLMFGRLAAYKGLGVLVEAVERATKAGASIHLGVFGAGSLDGLDRRLAALGAEVVNRWVSDEEAVEIFARHDVLALPYTSASQSGVAAVALGTGLPVVATNVGGLVEQVHDGVNGLVTPASASSLSAALARLAADEGLRARLSKGAQHYSETHSMSVFFERFLESVS